MTALLIIINAVLGYYLFSKIYYNMEKELIYQADYIISSYPNPEELIENFNHTELSALYHNRITIVDSKKRLGTHLEQIGDQYFLELVTPYPVSKKYLKITQNITKEKNLLTDIYTIMLVTILLGVLFILYYASVLSANLMNPLKELTYKFSNMNESILRPLNLNELPLEFMQLAESVNRLITKIKTSINYRKELYVGTAHELKTPLAVMRLKNQINLMKYKKDDSIKETLQQNLESIDNLNNMIHNILEFGRAEGMQFEEPKRINIIRFMAEKAEEYELLAHSQNRDFIYHFDMERFMITIQPLLFMQIFQNFIQNALRFTPEGGLVTLTVRTDPDNFIVEITDEGVGIDEDQDLFAPFKRSVDSTGAGLGLFLAQNAAESMGVNISLRNRKDRQGAIASISFPFGRFLHREI
jgi:two-component system OmpR family sensor kinase